MLKSMTDIVFQSLIESRQNMHAYEEVMAPKPTPPVPKVSLSSVSALKEEPSEKETPKKDSPPSKWKNEDLPEKSWAVSSIYDFKYCDATGASAMQKMLDQSTVCSDPLPDRLTSCLARSSTCIDLYPRFLKNKPVFDPEDPFVNCITMKSNCYKEEEKETYSEPTPQAWNFIERCSRKDEFIESDIEFYINELKRDCPSLEDFPAIVNCKTFAYMCEEAKNYPEEKLQELNQITQCLTEVNNCIDLY